MSYGLYADLFADTEKNIEAGLCEQAEDLLNKVKNRRLSKPQRVFAEILAADICSRLGRFSAALAIQKKILTRPSDAPELQEAGFHSHAYTLGYTGNHGAAYAFFRKAQAAAEKNNRPNRYYASVLGSIDIEFHDYNYNRFSPEDNQPLLNRVNSALEEIRSREDFRDKELYAALLSFRKAMLLWLNKHYRDALGAFKETRRAATGVFHVWALFGLCYCAWALKDRKALAQYEKELCGAVKRPAWKKTAMRYWPVALLLGRTWEKVFRDSRRAQEWYRKILLTVRNDYTNQKTVTSHYASFITNYFYPVYYEAVQHLLKTGHEYRYALNRAEMFRARFLTEEYKRHYAKKRTDNVLTPNIRIDEIGSRLAAVFDNDVTLLYCFDFGDSGVLLLSRNPARGYTRFLIDTKAYAELARLTLGQRATKDMLDRMSRIFEKALDAVSGARLIIIPHGVFNSVPFHALKRNNAPLLKDTIVNYWPSLHMAVLGENGPKSIPRSALFVGTRSDPASPGELASLAALTKKSRCLYDPRRSQLIKAFRPAYGITHFVTHGVVSCTAEDLTVMRFAWGDFKFSDLARSLLSASPLVALNVCYGGRLEHDAAEFLRGLPVMLFQKGALSLLVSTREIEQRAGRLFYERLYANFFSGRSLGEAYRRAVLDADDIDCMLVNAPRIMGTCDIRVQ